MSKAKLYTEYSCYQFFLKKSIYLLEREREREGEGEEERI